MEVSANFMEYNYQPMLLLLSRCNGSNLADKDMLLCFPAYTSRNNEFQGNLTGRKPLIFELTLT